MTQRWLIVFSDLEPLDAGAPRAARLLHWCLDRLLRPGFRHVFAVRVMPGGYLVLNPNFSGLDLLALPGPLAMEGTPYTADQWFAGLQASIEAGSVRAIWAVANRPGPMRPRLLVTCVSAVKHLLGLPGWAITPHQLYRQLTEEN